MPRIFSSSIKRIRPRTRPYRIRRAEPHRCSDRAKTGICRGYRRRSSSLRLYDYWIGVYSILGRVHDLLNRGVLFFVHACIICFPFFIFDVLGLEKQSWRLFGCILFHVVCSHDLLVRRVGSRDLFSTLPSSQSPLYISAGMYETWVSCISIGLQHPFGTGVSFK